MRTHDPEFTAVILAATSGARLFPITHGGDETEEHPIHDPNDDNDDLINDNEPTEEHTMEDETPTENEEEKEEEGRTTKNHQNHLREYTPKHLLPLVGRPLLYHLLLHLKTIGFELCIVAIGSNDNATLPTLLRELQGGTSSTPTTTTTDGTPTSADPSTTPKDAVREIPTGNDRIHTLKWEDRLTIEIVTLPQSCGGSADALRFISKLHHRSSSSATNALTNTSTTAATTTSKSSRPVLPPKSHCMVLPGDLVLYGHLGCSSDALSTLASTHRAASSCSCFRSTHPHNTHHHNRLNDNAPPSAVTLLLTDVSEYDDNGCPLKESAKAKKGGLARDDDEIEFIALVDPPPSPSVSLSPSSSTSAPTSSPTTIRSDESPTTTTITTTDLRPSRIILKRSKYSVEEEDEPTAATPKLTLPKSLLRKAGCGSMTVRTEWSDVHVFCLSPWVVRLLDVRTNVKDLAKELVPLLVARQWRGVRSVFGGLVEEGGGGDGVGVGVDVGVGVGGGGDTSESKENEETNRTVNEILREPPFRRTVVSSTASTTTLEHRSDFRGPRDGGPRDGGGGEETGSRREEDTDTTLQREHNNNGTNALRKYNTTRDVPFAVSAVVLPRAPSKLTLRACTVPAYLYACRETILHVTGANTNTKNNNHNSNNTCNSYVPLPTSSTLDSKFKSLHLNTTTPPSSNKNQIKSSTIGRRTKLGSRCRFNNVVVMDDVTVGDNCVLQNSVLARGCSVGENCNLKDCQVESGYRVVDGTKATGECFFDG